MTLNFNWLDDIPAGCDVSTFTLDGDAAPNDRFTYRAGIGAAPKK